MTDLTPTLCRFINSYLFKHIWNEPYKEFRTNLRLMVLTDRSVINTTQLRVGTIALPVDNTQYYIFATNKDVFGGLNVSSTNWISLTDYNNLNTIQLKMFSKHGKVLYHDEVYIKNDPYNKFLIVAIGKKMFRTILGPTYLRSDVFVELYYDSDLTDDITMWSAHPTTTIARQTIWNHITSSTTLILINGQPSLPTVITDIALNDYVEVINDNNVTITFDIDLTVNDEDRVFLSTRDSMYKQIVHIPKALNPNNKVITHNTCDVYVYPKHHTTYNQGLLLHRAQNNKGFDQITHNDFSIPMYLIEDYQNLVGTEEIILKVQCRLHDKNNNLIQNNSYIDLLYTHDDQKILDFFENEVSVPFTFWTADELERCKYVEMFSDTPETVDPSNIDIYVEALGYYQVLALICPRIQRFNYTEELNEPFGIVKPSIYGNTPVKVHTYIKGLKVPNTTTEFNNTLSVLLPEAYNYTTNDTLIVECFEYPNNNIYEFIPTTEEHIFIIAYDTFKLYEQSTLSEPILGVDTELDTIYTEKTIASDLLFVETVDGITTITFTTQTYDKTYIIQHDTASYQLTKDITANVIAGEILVVDLYTDVYNTDNVLPILNPASVIVHLNNKTLVKNIDYRLVTVSNSITEIALYQVVIQNNDYLTTTTNIVEVFTLPVIENSCYSAFLRNNYVPVESGMFFDNLSTLSVDGQIVKDVIPSSNGYDVSEVSPRLGAIYELRTTVTAIVEQYIASYYKTDDAIHRQQLIDYFNVHNLVDADIIVIPHSHKIYSIYLAAMIKDILNDTLVVGIDPDPTKTLATIVGYDHLKIYDNVFQNTTMDLRYIDLLGTYIDHVSVPVATYTLIQQLVTAGLPVDTITY